MRLVVATVHHRDAGNEYTSQRCSQRLAVGRKAPSSGSIGDAFDNAAAEAEMDLFKNEIVAKKSPFRTGQWTAEADIADVAVEWVNRCNKRLHSTLDHRPHRKLKNSIMMK